MSQTFYDRFKQRMDLVGMPAPQTWFETVERTRQTLQDIFAAIGVLGVGAKLAEAMPAARIPTNLLAWAGGISASAFAGYAIGAALAAGAEEFDELVWPDKTGAPIADPATLERIIGWTGVVTVAYHRQTAKEKFIGHAHIRVQSSKVADAGNVWDMVVLHEVTAERDLDHRPIPKELEKADWTVRSTWQGNSQKTDRLTVIIRDGGKLYRVIHPGYHHAVGDVTFHGAKGGKTYAKGWSWGFHSRAAERALAPKAPLLVGAESWDVEGGRSMTSWSLAPVFSHS